VYNLTNENLKYTTNACYRIVYNLCSTNVGEPEEKEVAEAAPTLPPVEFFHYTDDSKVAGVIIHKSDKLRSNFLLQHPLVRVHIIDVDTGQYLIKQDK